MDIRNWKRLVRSALPKNEDWRFRGRVCYRNPPGWVMQGVAQETSAFSKASFVWKFRMPLFVPSSLIHFTYSERVGGGSNLIDDADVEQVKEAIENAIRESYGDPLTMLAQFDDGHNRAISEVRAYALLLLGDLDGARTMLQRAASLTGRREWELAIRDRALQVADALDSNGDAAAIHKLEDWRRETCDALGF